MKMEKEEKMTTADPKATKETVELWHYLHAVAGKQIITGQHTRPSPVRRLLISGRPPEKSQSCVALNYWGILRISIMQTLPRNV